MSLCGDDHISYKMLYLLKLLQCCPLVSDNILYIKCPFSVKEREQELSERKQIADVCSTSANGFVSYPAHRQNE